MKIQLKRSNVLEGGSAKQPTAQQMEYGELAVNYNEADPTLFIKDSANKIIPIAGDSHILNLIQENEQINISPTPPVSPGLGDLWLDMSECPPELNVWSDCETAGGEWLPIGGGSGKPIDPNVGDGSYEPNPMPGGGTGSAADPFILTPVSVGYGESAETVETISFSGYRAGDLVQWVDTDSATNGNRFDQPIGVIGEDGTWSGKLRFEDTPVSTSLTTYTGKLKIGSTSLYYNWDVTAVQVQVGKGVISPDVDVVNGSSINGTATVTDSAGTVSYIHEFQNDPAGGSTWVNLPSIESNNPIATTTAVEGSMRYRMGIKDDNNVDTWVYGEWSDTLTVGEGLAVGKGVITPSVDVEVGDTLTGSATVTNASNPVETHVWELDGIEDQRGSNATYTAKAGVVRYRKEVTDDYATAIGETPARTTQRSGVMGLVMHLMPQICLMEIQQPQPKIQVLGPSLLSHLHLHIK